MTIKEKACGKCGEVKPRKEFYKSRRSKSGLQSWCKWCCSMRNQASTVRRSRLKAKYGITPEDYEAILVKQDGRCAICKTATSYTENCKRRLAVDHCHETGKVRGLLCQSCNQGVGCFSDDPERLQNAAEYLFEGKVEA